MWAGGKNSNDSEGEMNLTEDSIAGAAAIHLWLTQPECSPVATMKIASNETLAYADIAFNETSPILRPTNPQSH